jgi:hypothetical protein
VQTPAEHAGLPTLPLQGDGYCLVFHAYGDGRGHVQHVFQRPNRFSAHSEGMCGWCRAARMRGVACAVQLPRTSNRNKITGQCEGQLCRVFETAQLLLHRFDCRLRVCVFLAIGGFGCIDCSCSPHFRRPCLSHQEMCVCVVGEALRCTRRRLLSSHPLIRLDRRVEHLKCGCTQYRSGSRSSPHLGPWTPSLPPSCTLPPS